MLVLNTMIYETSFSLFFSLAFSPLPSLLSAFSNFSASSSVMPFLAG